MVGESRLRLAAWRRKPGGGSHVRQEVWDDWDMCFNTASSKQYRQWMSKRHTVHRLHYRIVLKTLNFILK